MSADPNGLHGRLIVLLSRNIVRGRTRLQLTCCPEFDSFLAFFLGTQRLQFTPNKGLIPCRHTGYTHLQSETNLGSLVKQFSWIAYCVRLRFFVANES